MSDTSVHTEAEEPGGLVVVLGPIAPPMTGAAYVTMAVVEDLRTEFEVRTISVPGASTPTLKRIFGKLRSSLTAIWSCRSRDSILYVSLPGGFALFYVALVTLFARSNRVLFHHHSWSYLQPAGARAAVLRQLMLLVALLGGHRASHISLSATMKKRLQGLDIESAVVSNAAFVKPFACDNQPQTTSRMTLGFLGRVCSEKGFEEALLVADQLAVQSECTLMVGGAIADADSAWVSGLVASASCDVILMGELDEVAKRNFFAEVDLLLFPSKYATEAEPVVVLESLAAGVPVVASRVGSLAEMLEGVGASMPIENFVGDSPRVVAELLGVAGVDRRVRQRFDALREHAQASWRSLVYEVGRNAGG